MSLATVGFGEAARVWARIALLSFGGPAGQIAVMHRILVEDKQWIGERRFLHALNFCMLLPGPEAQQLATYIGWLLHGIRGGLVAGILFILPGLAAIMALSWLYVAFDGLQPVEALFFGLKAAVLAIVLDAVRRIGRRTLTSPTAWLLAAAAFTGLFFFAVPFPLIIAVAGLVGFVALRAAADAVSEVQLPSPPAPSRRKSLLLAAIFLALWLAPVATLLAILGPDDVYTDIAVFFSKMAVVTFGGAYAVLTYVAQQAVENYGWLEPGEMLDGLGLAETTPGPLIMVTQFVGFLAAFRNSTGLPPMLAGTLGGLLTTWVTFVPCFLWIFLGAPYVERLRHNRAMSGALAAITSAVVGVILNLALWFAVHSLFGELRPVVAGPARFDLPVVSSVNLPALLLAGAAVVAVFRFRLGPAWVIAGCALAGLLWGMVSPLPAS